MSEEDQEPAQAPAPRRSCLSGLASLFTLLIILGLGFAVWQIYQPQDLSDIRGRGDIPAGQSALDILNTMQKATDGVYPVVLTDEQVNRYFKERIQLKQEGFLSKYVQLNNVCMRFSDDRAELILERSIFGHPFTTSMYLRVDSVRDAKGGVSKEVSRDGGSYFKEFPQLKRGGRFGRLEVPQGFLILTMPSFEKLYKQLDSEVHACVGDMNTVTMKKGSVVLDPRTEGDAKPFGHSF